MQNKKLLIAALALTLCTAAFSACGNGNVEESGSTAPGTTKPGSTTQSQATETESRGETSQGNTESGSTHSTTGTTTTESGSTHSTTGTTTTESGSATTESESGSATDSIGDDARRGVDNVKDGFEDFFGMGDNGKHGMKHRHRVPYGK